MGWWHTSLNGDSFAADSDLLWGDGPADVIDAAIRTVTAAWDRAPTEEELLAGLNGHGAAAGVMIPAASDITKLFNAELGRNPLFEEIVAGLKFSCPVEEYWQE